MLEPYYGTGRDVGTVNFFLSYNLAKLLLEKNLTLLGTIRAHRREIPTTLNNRIELFSSVFLYNHEGGVCLVAEQTKISKKPVKLLSSTHTENSVNTIGVVRGGLGGLPPPPIKIPKTIKKMTT